MRTGSFGQCQKKGNQREPIRGCFVRRSRSDRGLRRRAIRDRWSIDRDPFANGRLRLQPTRLAGNGDGDGACQRERDFGDLLAKEALARSR